MPLPTDLVQQLAAVAQPLPAIGDAAFVASGLARPYDAIVWFDETRAVTPLDAAGGVASAADTWPSGL